ncbi:MAG: hypothetical protein K0S32_1371 [Bacteroidetes bacterium]|jgi:hypothetical protein|nr:hypothetical protein [Bacteroidota bacterium]
MILRLLALNILLFSAAAYFLKATDPIKHELSWSLQILIPLLLIVTQLYLIHKRSFNFRYSLLLAIAEYFIIGNLIHYNFNLLKIYEKGINAQMLVFMATFCSSVGISYLIFIIKVRLKRVGKE